MVVESSAGVTIAMLDVVEPPVNLLQSIEARIETKYLRDAIG
jgi:hypothetical protein